ncbi:DUF4386 domain-containing protein [Dyadobacter diqingensis]|uniref:DUF4386 domain-containing protein n=1 Tax=Dyadobacter diqingensis TaxID=2938121 RepID=UPI0020C581CD|nr:DUF4386 domain-containing protein [Dyadobacter diqingensis]
METKAIVIKRNVQIVGMLILFRFAVGVSGIFLQEISDDLQAVSNHVFKNNIAITFDFLTGMASVAIAILLFPIMKKYSNGLAIWLLAFSGIGFANMIGENISVYTLGKLSQEFTAKGSAETALYQTLARSKVNGYMISHFFGLIIHCIGFVAFYVLLFQKQLVPRLISIFALIALLLVVTNTFLQIFDLKSSMLMYLPNSILQILLGTWLIVKGLNFKTVPSV